MKKTISSILATFLILVSTDSGFHEARASEGKAGSASGRQPAPAAVELHVPPAPAGSPATRILEGAGQTATLAALAAPEAPPRAAPLAELSAKGESPAQEALTAPQSPVAALPQAAAPAVKEVTPETVIEAWNESAKLFDKAAATPTASVEAPVPQVSILGRLAGLLPSRQVVPIARRHAAAKSEFSRNFLEQFARAKELLERAAAEEAAGKISRRKRTRTRFSAGLSVHQLGVEIKKNKALAELAEVKPALERIKKIRRHVAQDELATALAELEDLRTFFDQDGEELLALARLEGNLKTLGLPTYEKRVVEEALSPLRPTVAILVPATTHKLAIAREGGRQSPGDVHLILDVSWLSQEAGRDGRSKLLMRKGLYFDRAGRPVLAEYKSPRLVRYFANFHSPGGTFEREDGAPLERNLDVPMSNSMQLEKITNDKLVTRLLLEAKGIRVPASLAFIMPGHPLRAEPARRTSSVVRVAAMPPDREGVKKAVAQFLKRYRGEEVVVKGSGIQFHSGIGVAFFKRDQVDEIADHVIALSKGPGMDENAVLVDARITPPALYYKLGAYEGRGSFAYFPLKRAKVSVCPYPREQIGLAQAKEKKDWNFRVLVARTPWNGAATTGVFARAGAWGVPTAAEPKDEKDAAAVIPFEDIVGMLRLQHGLLKTDAEAASFLAELKAVGEKALLAIMENEAKRPRLEGEPFQPQTDFIGLDVMVEFAGGKPAIFDTEVNDHDSGGQAELDTFYPERAGEHSREWVATMLERARRDALRGKRIVVVGAGYEGKRFIFERARELGVKVILVDKGPSGFERLAGRLGLGPAAKDHWARGLVSDFIAADMTNHPAALAKAGPKLAALRKAGKIDGITNFYEDDVLLTARLAKLLGLPYHSVEAALASRDKYLGRLLEKKAGLPTPRFALARNAAELEAGLAHVGFPAVLKPRYGADAIGVTRVETRQEARLKFAEIKSALTPELDPIFAYGDDMLLEEYVPGKEWDADAVLQDGRAKFTSVADNWPTREPSFVSTGASQPSRALTPAERREAVALTLRSAAARGIRDGGIHGEGKTPEQGPLMLELAGRLGGNYVPHFIRAAWGVNLVDQQLMIAVGIPIGPFKPAQPLAYLEGEFIIPGESGLLKRLDFRGGTGGEAGYFQPLKRVGDKVELPYRARVGMVVGTGASAEQASLNLQIMRDQLTVELEPLSPSK